MHLIRRPGSAPSIERTGEVINRRSPSTYILRASLGEKGANYIPLSQP